MVKRFPAARGRLRPATLGVGLVALIGTVVLAVLAQMVNHGSNTRLIRLQVRQAATVLTASVPSLQAELLDGLHVALATGSPSDFERFMSARVGGTGFASVSLWRRSGSDVTMEGLVGRPPRLVSDGRASSVLGSATPSPRLHIVGVLGSPPGDRLGYVEDPLGDHSLLVYAESAIPVSRRFAVPRNSAFSDLNLALYLGPTADPSRLLESSIPLPVRGLEASSTVPFGDSFITVVGTPREPLAGRLSSALPWIVLGAGLVFTVASVALAEYVLRRRAQAERLAAENERLYLEQRAIASDFQQALLPELPRVKGMELAARYIAGTSGLDVGGDWYDVMQSSPGSCTFVIGDVCGRGLQAAATMAAVRFATRAYVMDGAGPADVLERLGRLPGLGDESFATVLVGTVDLASRHMTLASAGHLPPLIIDGRGSRYVPVTATTPIGVGRPAPEPVTVSVPPGSVVVAYTDGLVERRGESIDDGMERLRGLDVAESAGSVEALLDHLVAALVTTAAHDDTAVVALRWDA